MIFCKKTCIKAIQKNGALIIHRGIELSKRIPDFLFYLFIYFLGYCYILTEHLHPYLWIKTEC